MRGSWDAERPRLLATTTDVGVPRRALLSDDCVDDESTRCRSASPNIIAETGKAVSQRAVGNDTRGTCLASVPKVSLDRLPIAVVRRRSAAPLGRSSMLPCFAAGGRVRSQTGLRSTNVRPSFTAHNCKPLPHDRLVHPAARHIFLCALGSAARVAGFRLLAAGLGLGPENRCFISK